MANTGFTIKLLHRTGAEIQADVPQDGIVIGRSSNSADLSCSWDHRMSRRHGRVWVEDGSVWYEDLGSSNGSWYNQAKVTSKIRLSPYSVVVLGDTNLSLLFGTSDPTVPDGMTLQVGQRVSRQDFAGALKSPTQKNEIIHTLTDFVDKLLGTADLDQLAPCLRALYVHLPTVKHLFLVGPPVEGEPLIHLIDPKLLARTGEAVPGGVSRSLVEMAIRSGEAMIFSQADASTPQIKESTRLRGIRSAAYVPLISSQGSPLGVLGVDSPYSALPLHESNLQLLKSAGALLSARLEGEMLREQAQEQAMEARENEARRETLANFLKIASHDLKNPLTVVKMCGRLIENLSDNPVIIDLTQRMLDAERRAEQLIASYLEISGLQSAQALTLRIEECNLQEMVDAEFNFLERAYQRKDRPIALLNEVTHTAVSADRQKLQQILNNLIANAIKYGDAKLPQVRIRSTARENDIVVSISDNGRGISTEDQQRLFLEFQRVGDVQKIPGTGLGLWLSNILVRSHGGSMWVESKLEEGSTFFFSLPRGLP